jgi:hypothetical protein
MTPEEIRSGLEKLKKVKPAQEPQFFTVQVLLSRYAQLILSADKAVKLIEALEGAYEYEENYGKAPTFNQLNNAFEFRFLSNNEIEIIRNAKLLNVSVEDIRQAMRQPETQ